MITLKDFMETVNYRITEGSDFCWNCFGPNAYRLDSWDGDHDGHTLSITFDTQDQTVYLVEAFDYSKDRAYRFVNPEYKSKHDDEADERDVNNKEAWDDVEFVDLETEEDFLEKARAIISGEDYDTRVQVPLTLPDDSLFELMKMAHAADMTLNEYVEQLLRQAIELDLEKELDDIRPEYDFSEGVRGPVAAMTAKKKKDKK